MIDKLADNNNIYAVLDLLGEFINDKEKMLEIMTLLEMYLN